MGKERISLFFGGTEQLGFLEYIYFNALFYIDIYKSRGSLPGDTATKVEKPSNPPIPGLKLSNKVDKSCAIIYLLSYNK